MEIGQLEQKLLNGKQCLQTEDDDDNDNDDDIIRPQNF